MSLGEKVDEQAVRNMLAEVAIYISQNLFYLCQIDDKQTFHEKYETKIKIVRNIYEYSFENKMFFNFVTFID